MPRVSATEFKAKCLDLMDRVSEDRVAYVITKHGRPVAKLVPPDQKRETALFGLLQDELEFLDDLAAPAAPPEEWDSLAPRETE